MNHSSDSDSIFSVTAIYSFDPGMTILGLRKHQKFRTLRQNVALSTKLQKNSQDCEKETFSKRMNKQISRELNGTSHVTGLSCVPSLLIIQPISLWVLPQEPGLYIISLLPLPPLLKLPGSYLNRVSQTLILIPSHSATRNAL